MWIDDGSQSITSSGNTASCAVSRSGSPSNALWASPDLDTDPGITSPGIYAFRFHNVHGSGNWVGLTTRAKFAPGWKCKAAKYGGPGNTSNGGGLVHGHFGDEIKSGDIVEMKITVSDQQQVSVVFFHNQRCLGEAFHIALPPAQGLYPMVDLKNQGDQISIESIPEADIPTESSRQFASRDGFYGAWKLISYATAANTEQTPSDNQVTMEISPPGPRTRGNIGLHVKVANSMNFAIQQLDNGRYTAQGGMGMSTMMMPPPELQVIENFFHTFFACPSFDIQLLDNNELALVAQDDGPSARFQVYNKEFQPCTEDFLS